ncbi:restriction endonuclease subunit S [Enterococcus thailandicus]|uniref:restriction endonuclease subunit S n=1 Tax=Enterococcus thailandicus TaxID=417368 RepID=UPI0022DFE6D4|nr:restriction endonuclease subunit S [Enterococcus thailandicus]MDT2733110.1 restriction endonuclease subunit S [Enterococcus thailandicus]
MRFAGFDEEWEQRKLGEVVECFEYGLNAAAREYDGKNKYLRITDIDEETHLFKSEKLTSPDINLSNADNYKLKENDVLFARTGASVGKTYRYRLEDGLIYYAGFLIRARIKSEFSTEFIFQNTLTSKYNQYIKIASQRSGQPGVNAQEYSKFELFVPNLEEQQKIGSFFKQLDDAIALHQTKLEKLKQLKQAFLQKMFI